MNDSSDRVGLQYSRPLFNQAQPSVLLGCSFHKARSCTFLAKSQLKRRHLHRYSNLAHAAEKTDMPLTRPENAFADEREEIFLFALKDFRSAAKISRIIF